MCDAVYLYLCICGAVYLYLCICDAVLSSSFLCWSVGWLLVSPTTGPLCAGESQTKLLSSPWRWRHQCVALSIHNSHASTVETSVAVGNNIKLHME